MHRTILQVPMQEKLRNEAAQAAASQGFSSLQEAVRVFLRKLAQGEVHLRVAEREERLSPAAERRYAKIVADIKRGKNITKTKSLDELFAYLNS